MVPERLQGTLFKIFKLAREDAPLGPVLASKAVVTLSPTVAATISTRNDWYDSLLNV